MSHDEQCTAARYAETWAGYIAMERSRRNVREARSLYKKCHSRRLQDGGQAAICEAWLRFEREQGRCSLRYAPGSCSTCCLLLSSGLLALLRYITAAEPVLCATKKPAGRLSR